MLFKKNFNDVDYEDIQNLSDNRVEESEILDYKQEAINDSKLLKEVAAFANTSGGYLIYGIRESGPGGYPASIEGINAESCNAERYEQIIISNIRPRINVQVKRICIPDSEKVILLIRIPEGQNCPYYNNYSQKFHKRYSYLAKEMDEHEIEALYQKRFYGFGKLSKYVDEIVNDSEFRVPNLKFQINGHIIITPLNIEKNLVGESIQQLDSDINDRKLDSKILLNYLKSTGRPSRYGIRWKRLIFSFVEVHRNGLIHCTNNYGSYDDSIEAKLLSSHDLAVELLQTIKFANLVYSNIDFVGRVKIILDIRRCFDSYMPRIINKSYTNGGHQYPSDKILIERECDSWELSEEYKVIGKSMMDELGNHYGFWEYIHETD